MRPSGRAADQLREITLELGYAPQAEGSCLIRCGNTHVLCTATVQERVPPFLRNTGRGWVTAEYGMLPRATNRRTDREAARGRQSGRTQEIQRLIGRSLRAVTEPGGDGRAPDRARLRRAARRRRHAHRGDHRRLRRPAPGLASAWSTAEELPALPLREPVAAVACGIVDGEVMLDLDYAEDSTPQADANFVLSGSGAPRRDAVHLRGRAAAARAVRGHARSRRAGRARADRPASARRSAWSPERGAALRRATASCWRPTTRARCASSHAMLQAASHRGGLERGAGPARAGRGRRELRRQRAHQGACRGKGRRGLPALADNSGLVVHGLDGRPGVHSARWAGPGKDFAARHGAGARRAREPAIGSFEAADRGRGLRRGAVPRLAGRPRGAGARPGRGPAGRSAARRRAASATIRCSSRLARARPSPRCRRGQAGAEPSRPRLPPAARGLLSALLRRPWRSPCTWRGRPRTGWPGAAPRPRARARRAARRPAERRLVSVLIDAARRAAGRRRACVAGGCRRGSSRSREDLEASLAIDPRTIAAPQLADWRAAGIDRLALRAGASGRGGPGRAGGRRRACFRDARSISPSRARARRSRP